MAGVMAAEIDSERMEAGKPRHEAAGRITPGQLMAMAAGGSARQQRDHPDAADVCSRGVASAPKNPHKNSRQKKPRSKAGFFFSDWGLEADQLGWCYVSGLQTLLPGI
jgi:hypothetical protein